MKPETEIYAEPTCVAVWHDSELERRSLTLRRLDNLISRFEEPSSTARWDAPLFTISCFDPPLYSPGSDEPASPDAERIWTTITSGDIKPPNVATLPVSFLHS